MTARRVGTLVYDAYAAKSCPPRQARTLPWITYDDTMAHLPQARWIAVTAGRSDKVAQFRVNDTEAAYAAVIAGLGRTLLPRFAADRDERLRRIDSGRRGPALTRELWLLTLSEIRTLGRIVAVTEWIRKVVPQ